MVRNLKLLRVKMGISQQQLAGVLGISQQSINKYENHGVEPDIDMLIKMADYFNTSIDYLVGNSSTERKNELVEPCDLNEDETKVIEKYRGLTKLERESIHLVMDNYLR